MEFARSKVDPYIPLRRDNYYQIDDETIGFLDQYIFRFSKVQDLIGARLFPLTLEALAESLDDKAFFIEKHDQINWHKIHGLRNIIAHHYFGTQVSGKTNLISMERLYY